MLNALRILRKEFRNKEGDPETCQSKSHDVPAFTKQNYEHNQQQNHTYNLKNLTRKYRMLHFRILWKTYSEGTMIFNPIAAPPRVASKSVKNMLDRKHQSSKTSGLESILGSGERESKYFPAYSSDEKCSRIEKNHK